MLKNQTQHENIGRAGPFPGVTESPSPLFPALTQTPQLVHGSGARSPARRGHSLLVGDS